MVSLGILLPLIGTTIGSLFVFFFKSKFIDKVSPSLFSMAAGVMFAASIWSLLLPSLELANSFVIPSIGFIVGVLFLKLLNNYNDSNHLFFSITLHNIPEGIAVGVIFASFLTGSTTYLSAFLLSLGIAIQNIPEGAIISLPMRCLGNSKCKSFLYGFASGIVEPIFSVLSIIFFSIANGILPFCYGFAAGAMIFVCIDELIPDSRNKSNYASYFFIFGFLIMMILDVFFG